MVGISAPGVEQGPWPRRWQQASPLGHRDHKGTIALKAASDFCSGGGAPAPYLLAPTTQPTQQRCQVVLHKHYNAFRHDTPAYINGIEIDSDIGSGPADAISLSKLDPKGLS